MKRLMGRVAGLMVLFAGFGLATAGADTHVSVHVGIGAPLPPPVVVAPPPPVVPPAVVVAPAPAPYAYYGVPPYPGYVWQPGYYVGVRWVPGAWVPGPARYVAPRYVAQPYYGHGHGHRHY